jgi:hypothetical protein
MMYMYGYGFNIQITRKCFRSRVGEYFVMWRPCLGLVKLVPDLMTQNTKHVRGNVLQRIQNITWQEVVVT